MSDGLPPSATGLRGGGGKGLSFDVLGNLRTDISDGWWHCWVRLQQHVCSNLPHQRNPGCDLADQLLAYHGIREELIDVLSNLGGWRQPKPTSRLTQDELKKRRQGRRCYGQIGFLNRKTALIQELSLNHSNCHDLDSICLAVI